MFLAMAMRIEDSYTLTPMLALVGRRASSARSTTS